jgi:hypothetical protein
VDGEKEFDGEVLIYVLDLIFLDSHTLGFGGRIAFIGVRLRLESEARDTEQHLLDELTSLWPKDLSVATLSLGDMMPRCFLVLF